MAYMCELGMGQRVYLENRSEQTVVVMASGGSGQQQQASSSFQTGLWAAPPELFQTPGGVVIRLQVGGGDRYLQVQGGSMSLMGGTPFLGGAQQLQLLQVDQTPCSTVQPMQPMQPMQMGNMQMGMKPMGMQMGDMQMRMGSGPAADAAEASPAADGRRFCSQCGVAVKPDDRFCASCGHRLG